MTGQRFSECCDRMLALAALGNFAFMLADKNWMAAAGWFVVAVLSLGNIVKSMGK